MKFTKKQGRLLFWMRFDQMTSIRSFIQVPGSKDIYACGDYNVNNEATDFSLATYTAAIWRGDNMGNVNFYMTVQGTNPLSTATN